MIAARRARAPARQPEHMIHPPHSSVSIILYCRFLSVRVKSEEGPLRPLLSISSQPLPLQPRMVIRENGGIASRSPSKT